MPWSLLLDTCPYDELQVVLHIPYFQLFFILITVRRAEQAASLLCYDAKVLYQLPWRPTLGDSRFRMITQPLVMGFLKLMILVIHS